MRQAQRGRILNIRYVTEMRLLKSGKRSAGRRRAFSCGRVFRLLIGGPLLVALASCIAAPDFVSGDDKAALLDAYRAQSAQVAAEKAEAEAATIKTLHLRPAPTGALPLLTVDLERAELSRVVARILADPGVAYRTDEAVFHGRVSARFRDKPLIDGLNLILAGSGIYARDQGGVVTFGDRSPLQNAGDDVANISTNREISLRHLAASDVVALLERLFPEPDDEDTASLSYGQVEELNSVFLSGPPALVEEAVRVVSRADRPVAHVIIEALVVDIDTSSVESLGLSFSDGASGSFSAASLIPGQTGGNIVTTFAELAGNSAQVTATIDFLAAQNMAQVLARPYVATQSTKPATIEIVDDQFARVDTSSDDSSIITTDSITAGISMQITPIVMANEAIRLDLTLEDSRFSATAGDIIIAKQRSTASSSMIVQSGQTIVIGGLNSKYRLKENSGIPWLRNVPVLNALAGDVGAVEARVELVVYLTPYIWIPGLETPLPLQGKPSPGLPDLLSLENGGRAPK